MRTELPLREITIEEIYKDVQKLRNELQAHNHLDMGNAQMLTGTLKGITQSSNFVSGFTGAQINWATGNVEFNSGDFRGDISGASGTFTGAISIGSGDNIFKADANGIYLGHATFASAPFRVSMAGALTASSVTITGLDADDITETGAKKWAGETGADITGSHTAADTTAVNSLASTTLISGGKIGTNLVEASAINVTNLAAINADMGSLTAGDITLDSAGHIKSGMTDYLTGTGFWLGYSGGTKFSIGTDDGDYMTWNGSKLTIVGKLAPLYSNLVGQTIREGDPVFIADDNVTEVAQLKWFNAGVHDGVPGYLTLEKANQIVAESFSIPEGGSSSVIGITATRMKIGTNNNPGDWKISIQGDNGGEPDGSDIGASATLDSGDASPTGPNWTYVLFSSPVSLTRGTTYWLCVTSLEANDAVNYYLVYYKSTNYSGGGFAEYPYGGPSWNTGSTPDLLFELFSNTTTGQAYITDARTAPLTDQFLGFATAAVNGGGVALIQSAGIYTYPDALTAGVLYYLTDEDTANEGWGGIGVAAGTVNKIVGRAINAGGDLNIKSNNE